MGRTTTPTWKFTYHAIKKKKNKKVVAKGRECVFVHFSKEGRQQNNHAGEKSCSSYFKHEPSPKVNQ
jgi:hypothetical protein